MAQHRTAILVLGVVVGLTGGIALVVGVAGGEWAILVGIALIASVTSVGTRR